MSEAFNKVLDAAKAVTAEPVMNVVNQRLSNPFFLCFMSSWVICNWDRVLLILFSFSLSMEQRIETVKALPSNTVFFGVSIPHTHTFWYPLIISIIFVVGTPFITYIVDLLQNNVLTKKSTNDSQRKEDALDLKIKEIKKNVEYEYADAKARLNAEKANKEIEYSVTALEDRFNDMQVKVRDLNILIKDKEQSVKSQTTAYNQISSSLLNLRGELESKGQELVDLNSKIISNQKKLDNINNEISKSTLPFTTLGNLSNLSNLNTLKGLNSLNGLNSLSGLGNLNVKGPNSLSEEAIKLQKAAAALSGSVSKNTHINTENKKTHTSAIVKPEKDNKNNKN
ncbi:hypothetical protein [Enterobacter hormaechei]|uniref:hypothetical protein n=1 Tax=Enterobacter hormaechei TaxID=158836 RepID=UPI0039C4C473